MTTKKTIASRRPAKLAAVRQSPAYRHIDALLHTVRCIAQYEDTLCELLHEAKQTGTLSVELRTELSEILEKIPSHDYVVDLDAVRATLVIPKTSKKSVSTKQVKPAAASKSFSRAKNSGKKLSK